MPPFIWRDGPWPMRCDTKGLAMTLFDKIAAIFMTQAEGEAAAPAGGLGQIYGVLPYLLIFGIIYVLVIRPTSKQRKEHQELLGALKKDDEVVTTGGMYGKIVS